MCSEATGVLRTALTAPPVACVTCHVDHRGANVEPVGRRRSRNEGRCRPGREPGARTRLTTLETHPEFAIIRAGVESGERPEMVQPWGSSQEGGREAKVDPKAVGGCESCHQRAPKAPAFQPISFEQHCKTCHEPDISSASAGTFAAALAPAFGALPAGDCHRGRSHSVRQASYYRPDARRSVGFAIRAVVSACGEPRWVCRRSACARSTGCATELARSTQGGSGGAWIDNAERDRTKRLLTATATAIDPTQAASDLDAAMTAAFQQEWKTAPEGTAPSTSAAAAPGADNRREALRQMIDATIARARAAGNTDLESRASPASSAAPATIRPRTARPAPKPRRQSGSTF